jgi:iron complex outermembrane recepter protein
LEIYCATTYVPLYCSRFPNPVPAFRDLSGQSTPYSPRWTGSVTASYGVLLPGGYKFTTELSPYAQSSYNPDPDAVYPPLSGYLRLDARLSLEKPTDRWALDLIAKNVTDRTIPIGEVGGGGLPPESKEQPRSIAVQFRYKF